MRKLNLAGIAAILFIALISTQFSYGQMRGHGCYQSDHRKMMMQSDHRKMMMQSDHHKMMMEKLNLTDTQKDSVEELHFSHKREMIDLKAALDLKQLDKQELLSKGNYTRDDYLDKVTALSNAKDKMALAKANHRMDVYDLLTEEQRTTFNEIKCCMGNRMGMGKMRYRKMMNKF